MKKGYRISGEALWKNRQVKGYTQEKLSELSGISRSQIQRIERQITSNCKIDTFMKLSVALKLDLADLIDKGEINDE